MCNARYSQKSETFIARRVGNAGEGRSGCRAEPCPSAQPAPGGGPCCPAMPRTDGRCGSPARRAVGPGSRPRPAMRPMPDVQPVSSMAMWPGQRSHTPIGAGTAGSYRSRPSSPAGHTCHVLADSLHRRDADVRPRLFCSRVSAVHSSAVCHGRLARSARPMRADRPAARIRAPPRRPLRRCRFHLFTPSADYHRPPHDPVDRIGGGECRANWTVLDAPIRATHAHRQLLRRLTDPQGVSQIDQVWPGYPGDESTG